MTKVTVWAEPEVVSALGDELAGVTVSAAEIGALARGEKPELSARDYAVLSSHVFPDRQTLYDAVAVLGTTGVRTAVLLRQVEDDDLKKVVFAPNVDASFEVDADAGADEALAAIAERIRKLTDPPGYEVETLVRIGTFATVGSTTEPDHKPDFAYRAAGFRSLVPHDGSDFVRQVRDVVTALSRYPLRPYVPWDPYDRGERDGVKVRNLQDVMQAFATTPQGRSRTEITPKAARKLLDGELDKGQESVNDWKPWHEAWSRGRPPLLLIEGDTGVGKSFMAEYIAFVLNPRRSERQKATSVIGMLGSRDRFVKFNGAGLTLQDFNHYLMGAAPEFWSGVPDAVVGQLTRAAHGVFFLDEIGDMAPDVQAAFLTFLDTREIRPSGMHPPFKGFQHIIAATNHDLDTDVASKDFRQDLLARFALRLWIPPLKHPSRRKHLPRFIDYLAQDPIVNPRDKKGALAVTAFTEEAFQWLCSQDYERGNFRELTAAVHGAIREAQRRLDTVVTMDDVVAATSRPTRGGAEA